jgi:hypothetical protein
MEQDVLGRGRWGRDDARAQAREAGSAA